MKQTAVEWLAQIEIELGYISIDILEQAKEMEKQQQDEFAIGFAEWIVIAYTGKMMLETYNIAELLEIYKKEKGL
jgi:hypothetical protein